MSQGGFFLDPLRPHTHLSRLLFVEEVPSRLLLFQLGTSDQPGPWTVGFGLEDLTASRLPNIFFMPFSLKLKDNKQGEVILLQLAIRGPEPPKVEAPLAFLEEGGAGEVSEMR